MSHAEGGALVLFSGGQDSTTCLAWALDRFQHIETVGYTYGQRHEVEMHAVPVTWASAAIAMIGATAVRSAQRANCGPRAGGALPGGKT